MKRLAASVMILACLTGAASAADVYQTRKTHRVVVQQPQPRPAPLMGIPVVGTVVQGSLGFAETLIYAPFELLGYRR